jgi:hypothetical protein
MILKGLLGLFFAGALAFSAMAADVVIRLAPPRAVIERRSPRPSRNHVWVNGYQRWDGNAYSWNQGRWEQPPRPRARWVQHRYTRQRGGGYVYVQGHWR